MGTEERISLEQHLDRLDWKPSEGQLKILKHENSPLNGISCAGSGKTTTILHKIISMIEVQGVKPNRILAVTFSKAGADEMKSKFSKLAKPLGLQANVEFSTMHANYLSLITKFKGRPNIIDDTESIKILQQLCRKHIQPYTDETLENVTSLLGYCINNMLFTRNEIVRTSKFITSNLDYEQYENVKLEYEQYKKSKNSVDFDDMQLIFYSMIADNPSIREKIHQMWDYIIVDEYQDVSKLQVEILKLMVGNPDNLITIGDDDQCIYEWRGSKIDYIVDMPMYFNGTSRIIMDTNYRCPSGILAPIIKSITKNKRRIAKEFKTAKDGGKIRAVECINNFDCSQYIADDIINSENMYSQLGEIAVLYRNNRQPMFVIDKLLRRNIPVQVKNASGLLYNHFIVKDIKDIINFALNQYNPALFRRVGYKILKYVPKSTIYSAAYKMNASKSWYTALDMETEQTYDTKNTLDAIAELVAKDTPLPMIITLVEEIYRNYLDFLSDKLNISGVEINDILDYLREVSENDTFGKFYSYIEVAKSLVAQFSKSANAVKIMTMHSAKGLEFKRVYILNDSEEHCPSKRIHDRIESEFGAEEAAAYIEQERRLHYVAWTRAKEELVVTYDSECPSRFLMETEVITKPGQYGSVELVSKVDRLGAEKRRAQ